MIWHQKSIKTWISDDMGSNSEHEEDKMHCIVYLSGKIIYMYICCILEGNA